jgi:hypothetical protein
MRGRGDVLVPLHYLVFKPNIPAGLDWAILGLWVCRFRKTADPCDPPITVLNLDGVLWRVVDGRHRVVAAMIAGRTHIEAEEA